jgi:hypothetical protein
MDNKKLSFWWAAPIGLIFPVLQIAIYYFRFEELDPYTPWLDYLWYYLAGVAGVLLLILLLHRSRTRMQKWIVFLAFLLATPISSLMMRSGGVLGPLGIILFPTLNWVLFSGFGFLVGRFFSRKQLETT